MRKHIHLVPFLAFFLPAVAGAADPGTFVSLDRVEDATYLGVDSGTQEILYYGAYRGLGTRVDVHGQVVHGNLGFYGALPVAYIALEPDAGGYSAMASGNFLLGGFYRLRAGAFDLHLRASVTLPTGTMGWEEQLVLETMAYQRTTDITALLAGTWARAGVSARHRRGSLFVQADLSVEGGGRDDFGVLRDVAGDFVLHANAGIGLAGRGFSLTAELATLRVVHRHIDPGNASLQSATVSAEIPLGAWRPTLGLIVPWSAGEGVQAYVFHAGLRRAL